MKSGTEYLKQAYKELMEILDDGWLPSSEAIAIHAQTLQGIDRDKQSEDMLKGVSGMLDGAGNIFKMLEQDAVNSMPPGSTECTMTILIEDTESKKPNIAKYEAFAEQINNFILNSMSGGLRKAYKDCKSIIYTIDAQKKEDVQAEIITINTKQNFNYNLQFKYGTGPIREQAKEV